MFTPFEWGRRASFNPRPALRPGAAFHKDSACISLELFQSSPGSSAGRRATREENNLIFIGFNPRPALRPGAAPRRGWISRSRPCFNPRPALRPGAASKMAKRNCFSLVSILARLFGRAPRNIAEYDWHGFYGFNPRPALRPGAASGKRGEIYIYEVSILARLFGRAPPLPPRLKLSHTRVSILARLFGRAPQ